MVDRVSDFARLRPARPERATSLSAVGLPPVAATIRWSREQQTLAAPLIDARTQNLNRPRDLEIAEIISIKAI
jgi:hypothetical protein